MKNPKKDDGAETEFMSTLSNTLTSIGDIVTKQHQQPVTSAPVEDAHDMWAKLVAIKVRRMDEMKAEEFKLRVDTLALEFLKNWL